MIWLAKPVRRICDACDPPPAKSRVCLRQRPRHRFVEFSFATVDGGGSDFTAARETPIKRYFDALQQAAQAALEWSGGLEKPSKLCCEFMPSHEDLKEQKVTLDLELPEGLHSLSQRMLEQCDFNWSVTLELGFSRCYFSYGTLNCTGRAPILANADARIRLYYRYVDVIESAPFYAQLFLKKGAEGIPFEHNGYTWLVLFRFSDDKHFALKRWL